MNKLEKISCFKPGGAFYAFPNVTKTNLSGNEFADIALNKHGVALVPGSSFGNSANDFVRLSYGTHIKTQKALLVK